MLKNLYLSPLTSITFSIEVEEFLPTLPIPMILPLLLSPKVTNPPSLGVKEVNYASSSVICLDYPLSKY